MGPLTPHKPGPARPHTEKQECDLKARAGFTKKFLVKYKKNDFLKFFQNVVQNVAHSFPDQKSPSGHSALSYELFIQQNKAIIPSSLINLFELIFLCITFPKNRPF
jgi:hypothetical protein